MRFGLVIAVLAGCSMGDINGQGDDTTGDAAGGCDVFLTFDPMTAYAGPTTEVRVNANVTGTVGVLDYTWTVTHGGANVTFQMATPTVTSSIKFFVPDTGPYHVMVMVSGGSPSCPTAQGDVNVGVPNGTLQQVRLRLFPPAGVSAPPQEKLEQIPGGADWSLNNVTVDTGVMATGFVKMGTTPVPSYLRFVPAATPDAFVEAFTDADGKFDVRMLNQPHTVLVVPTIAGFAPRAITGFTPGSQIAVDAGTAITGTVLDPAGAPLANAHVQLEFAGVPSTLATTNGAGAFSVLAAHPGGSPEVHVKVTPPAATGLPRIAGVATTAQTVFAVQYSPSLVRRDIGGAVVRRAGAAQANAPVKIVGTIAAAATINTTVDAIGEVRIATQANGAGAIPNGTLVPAAPLSAVSTIGAQLAVGAFDTTASVPATIDAPAAVSIVTQLRKADGTALPNALIDLAPAGALEMAGAPAIRASSDAAGNASLLVPAGGTFDVRASDPQGRGAPLLLADVPTAGLSSSHTLKPALHVTGSLVLSGNPSPVGRATVQILCTMCTGAERSRPLAEGSTSSAGAFDVAVFDPGTM